MKNCRCESAFASRFSMWDERSREAEKKPPEVFCKKSVLKNSTKFTGKHLCKSLLIKLQALRLQFKKKKTQTQLFFCEFCEISKNTFFTERLWMTASGEGYPCEEAPQFEGINSKRVVIFPL